MSAPNELNLCSHRTLAGTIARSSTAVPPLPLLSSQAYACERYRGVDTARA
jgi:hypothetical protein